MSETKEMDLNRCNASRAFDPDGPAVILGDGASIFSCELAAIWRDLGRGVVLVTDNLPATPIEGVSVVDSRSFRRRGTRWMRAGNPVLRYLERTLPRLYIHRYQKRTGRMRPESWEWYWVDHFWDSFSRARAVLAQRPSFVFGNEASGYGLATALCRGVPRILMPWGGDIYNAVESSPVVNALTTYALKHVDLVMPGSAAAAEYIPGRFGVPAARVVSVSWGADLELFRPATPSERHEFCVQHGIPDTARIVLNSRRFNPLWGASEALEACLQVCSEDHSTWFVFFGGAGSEDHVALAKLRIKTAGMQNRFVFLEGDIPLAECARAMSVAEIFLSLLQRGDMRSWSVLQATAAGGIPVIADIPEHRHMQREGFAAELFNASEPSECAAAILRLLANPERMQSIREVNREFIVTHEDSRKQMNEMLNLIDSVRNRYADNATIR
jgi:glycosyltransferase involved in cell wall biosynthesis